MPYDDEEPPFVEPDEEMNALTHAVIGAAMEVHRQLGAGLDELLYENAMCIELTRLRIPFVRQAVVKVFYRGESIGERRIDLIVAERLVVELKSIEALAPLHSAQVRTYLKITNLQLGLLINFNVVFLKDGVKRIINSSAL